jgi:hypothetical protein
MIVKLNAPRSAGDIVMSVRRRELLLLDVRQWPPRDLREIKYRPLPLRRWGKEIEVSLAFNLKRDIYC